RPVEIGPRITFTDFEDFHGVTGLRGQIGESTWKWELAFLWDRTEIFERQTGGVLIDAYQAALNASAVGSAFNPFGFTPVFGTSTVNSQSFLQSMIGEATEQDIYTTQQLDAHVGGDVFDLPGGPIQISVGAETRRDEIDIRPDFAIVNAAVFPFNTAPAYSAGRQTDAAFGEIIVPVFGPDFSVPAFSSLSINAAGRYEEFSDAGDTGVKPRVGFRWQPIPDLTIRGTYAQGFIAPSLAALYRPAGGQDFPELKDPQTGLRTQPEDGVLSINNPNLEPEEADTFLIGFRYSPKDMIPGLTIGADYYRVEQTNIPFESAQFIVNQWFAAGPSNPANPFGEGARASAANPTGAQVLLDSTGAIRQIINVGPINSGARLTDGIDFTVTQEVETGIGKFTLSGLATHVLTFEQENFPGAGQVDYLGKFWGTGAALEEVGFPEWRATVSLEYKYDRYYAAFGVNITGSYDEDASGQNFETSDPVGSPLDVRDIGEYYTFDVRLGYTIPWIEADLLFGINNILDEEPPLVLSSFESNIDRTYADLRGRYWFVSLTKQF
ncbi:MAG: TonB-dependent receptor, partial [Verrucomicrobiota bacterium]